MNSDLNVSYFLLEQPKYSYEVNNYEEMENGFKIWLVKVKYLKLKFLEKQ